jgi:tRNA uridine 5-carboxymethylaminomethyl modification enzyme
MGAFDIIVVGGGHAGAEAAWAAARLGAKVLLLTMRRDTIAKMSCNPAIGGLGKGQIVREIDALGGLMGLATDATGIQFRMLNRSKGPAVQSPRAQTDKYQYQAFVQAALEGAANLTIAEHTVGEVMVRDGRVRGVRCEDGTEFAAAAVILTTGTFLRGVMHMGPSQWPGGRLDEPASNALSDCLRGLGLRVGRLKTGTPVRLDGATLDYDRTEEQPGDAEPVPFSFMHERVERPSVPCWITYTNAAIHELLRANLHLAPMYSGQIQSVGPRYCPSIETKIMRFADKSQHQVFLEPEDEAATTIYCNGISTSYPKEIQEAMLRLMPGTERARIVHYAYAIEYDYCPATQLKPTLETRDIGGLYLAGQINGTSGYEEAAGQGLLAGVNAALRLGGREPLVLGREQAYLGVMVDDLLTREIDEPYRMFTSRAEYRLTLRSDNADARLTPVGHAVGLADEGRWARFCAKQEAVRGLETYLKATRTGGKSLWEWAKQPGHSLAEDLTADAGVAAMGLSREAVESAAIACKYEGYLARQDRMIASFESLEKVRLPEVLEYGAIPHLRCEAKERLAAARPFTLGQAGRVGGITPADITVIQIYLKKVRAGKHGEKD